MLILRFMSTPGGLPFSFALCCLSGLIDIDLLCRHMHQCTLTERPGKCHVLVRSLSHGCTWQPFIPSSSSSVACNYNGVFQPQLTVMLIQPIYSGLVQIHLTKREREQGRDGEGERGQGYTERGK